MKKILITLAVIGLSSAAFAQAAKDFTGADTDKSGDVSLTEAQVIWPKLTADDFKKADTDGVCGVARDGPTPHGKCVKCCKNVTCSRDGQRTFVWVGKVARAGRAPSGHT